MAGQAAERACSHKTLRVRGRHYATGQMVDVVCTGETVCSVEAPCGRPDVAGAWVAPALWDVQINGACGHDFSMPGLTPDKVESVIRYAYRHGVARFLATVITGPPETTEASLQCLARCVQMGRQWGQSLLGIHLEGPWISAEDGPRGAHCARYVRPPSWDEFQHLQDCASGLIRMVTLAPELPGGLEFIEKLHQAGIVVALGHTAASSACIAAACRAGARLSTHLGNGCHALLPRHDNYFLAQLACDDLWASIITDGHHLPPALIRIMVRVKGPERLLITSDASGLAGCPPGTYRHWGTEVEVRANGQVVLSGTPYLAGSSVLTDACVWHLASLGEVTLTRALDMASQQPARLLGLPEPGLYAGAPGDLILYECSPEDGLRVVATVVGGEITWRVT